MRGHYNYFRDYDPRIGRYVESDPIGLRGGINTYGYVGGSPLGNVDPTGLATFPLPTPWPTCSPNSPSGCRPPPPSPPPSSCLPEFGRCVLSVGLGPIPGPLTLNALGYGAAASNSLTASRAVVLGAGVFWGAGPIGSTLSLNYAPLVCLARMSGPMPQESPFSYGP